MKFALVTLFALTASFSLFAGKHQKREMRNCEDEAPLFQNAPCGGWAVETQSLFNGDACSSENVCMCNESEDDAPLFQNQPCSGWLMHTRSLFNG